MYSRNDIERAVKNLKKILDNHEENITEYQTRNKELIDSFSVNNSTNQKIYLDSIIEVLES